MKKLVYASLIFALVVAASCSKKDPKAAMVGTWQLDSVTGEELTDAEKAVTVTFSEDGTYERAFGDEKQTGTFEVSEDGKTVTVKPEGGSAETMNDVKIDGDKLTFKDKDTEITLKKK